VDKRGGFHYADRCNEAVYTLYNGKNTVEEIDRNMPAAGGMGTLAWIDFVGLDTVFGILNVLYEEYGNQKFYPCPLLRRLVEAGHLGQKTGIGFYDYSTSPREAKVVSPYVLRF